MIVELWTDEDGYRLLFEDREIDLSSQAFQKLIETFAATLAIDEPGDYRHLCLDLPEDEDGKL